MRKISLWAPVVLAVIVNLYLSSQPAGSSVLERFPLPFWLGHFTGYFVLSVLLYRALAGGLSEWKGRAAWVAFLAAFIYGIIDEFHQGFVPGRDSSHLDVLVDGAGAMAALLVVRFWVIARQPARGSAPAVAPARQTVTRVAQPYPAGFLLYFLIVLGALFMFPITIKLLSLLLAVTLIFMVGLLDRTVRMNPFFILLGQGAAALILVQLFKSGVPAGFVYYHSRLQEPGLTGAVIFLLLVGWVVLITNSFGLVRSMDGFAAGMVLAIGAALAAFAHFRPAYLVPALVLLILGACIGLLPYNFRLPLFPLGHNGGMLLGFSLAAFLLLRLDSPFFPPLVLGSLFLFIYPAADITFTLIERLSQPGKSAGGARRTLSANEKPGWRRAVFLFYLLCLSGTVYLVYIVKDAAKPLLGLLLALFSLPGFFYTPALLGLFKLDRNKHPDTKSS